jgi:4-amino-4-deoxy-L-arabinose transferase-like glycosyltransferase
VLVVLCALSFLPGLTSIPVIDRDEARFAQASRQVASSDTLEGWVVPRIQDRPRLNKPILVYWLQAGTARLLTGGDLERDAIWMYRVPSAVLACITVLITWRLGASMFGARTGLLAGAMLAVAPMVTWEANQSRADHLLMTTTCAAMASLWFLWRSTRTGRAPALLPALCLWAFVGLGILAKGPVTPMVVLLGAATLAIVSRRWRWLRPWHHVLGVGVACAILAPWLIMIHHAMGVQAYLALAAEEIRKHSTDAIDAHRAPPGYHLVLLVVMFWPGCLLTAMGVVRACSRALQSDPGDATTRRGRLAARWRTRSVARGAELFCLCWLVPGWIFFELMSTKLPHYVLPMYPAVALLSARAVIAGAWWVAERRRRGAQVGFVIWLLVGIALAGLPIAGAIVAWRGGWMPLPLALVSLAGGAGALGLTVLSLRMASRWNMVRAQVFGIGAALMTIVVLLGVVLPNMRGMWISSRLMELVDEADPAGVHPVGSVRYHEDSMIFQTRGRFARLGSAQLDEWMRAHPGATLILPRGMLQGVPEMTVVGTLGGFNYANGETVDLAVLRVPLWQENTAQQRQDASRDTSNPRNANPE